MGYGLLLVGVQRAALDGATASSADELRAVLEALLRAAREAGAAIETVRQKASDRGLYTGIFCSDTDMCHRRMDQGFQLVNAANDSAVLKSGYVGQVSRLKKTAAGPGGKTGY